MDRRTIVGGTVIDGTGRPPIEDAFIVIEDGKIVSIGAESSSLSADTQVIDARGKWVIPGLLDANVHLVASMMPERLIQYDGRFDELAVEAAQIALKAGVTTIFDTWGPIDSLTLVRDRIARGDIVGSRLYVAGNIIGLDGPLSIDFFHADGVFAPSTADGINQQWQQDVGRDLLWRTPDEVRQVVRGYIERTGIDFVKYAASGHAFGQMQLIAFSAEAQEAIVEEAHRAGLTAQAHTTSPESLRMEIDAGADILQHGNITGMAAIPEATFARITDAQIPVAALMCTKRCMRWFIDKGQHAWMREIYNDFKEQNDQRLIDRGAKLLLTTDAFAIGPAMRDHPAMAWWKDVADLPTVMGEGHFLWLEAVIERGMHPMEALQSATRHVAEAYGKGAELGTIEQGKRADLLILDGDPLSDVQNYRRIVEVIKDGDVIDRSALPERRILTGDEDRGSAADLVVASLDR